MALAPCQMPDAPRAKARAWQPLPGELTGRPPHWFLGALLGWLPVLPTFPRTHSPSVGASLGHCQGPTVTGAALSIFFQSTGVLWGSWENCCFPVILRVQRCGQLQAYREHCIHLSLTHHG